MRIVLGDNRSPGLHRKPVLRIYNFEKQEGLVSHVVVLR